MAIDLVIYHNPECGTSRNVLGLIRNAGIEPHVVEYLKTPPSRALLVELIGGDSQASAHHTPVVLPHKRPSYRRSALWNDARTWKALMSEVITGNAVAIALMREALTLLDTEETFEAAEHLKRAIEAVEDAPMPPPEDADDCEHPSV